MAKKNAVADRASGYFTSTETPPVKRSKRTYYLPDEVIMLLDEVQLNEFRATGKKPDLSELVERSIREMAERLQQ